MVAALPSDLDDQSIQGRNLDEAYTEQEVVDGDKDQPDFRKEETSGRWYLGTEVPEDVARTGSCARVEESIEMPSMEIPVGQIRRYTSLASTRQLFCSSGDR